jgi:hypothetical protein
MNVEYPAQDIIRVHRRRARAQKGAQMKAKLHWCVLSCPIHYKLMLSRTDTVLAVERGPGK